MIPSFVINHKNSGYGTKPYKSDTEAIPQLVGTL